MLTFAVYLNAHELLSFMVVIKATVRESVGGLFPHPSRAGFVRVFFGFVQPAERALAPGLFGNVVGRVKEFTD